MIPLFSEKIESEIDKINNSLSIAFKRIMDLEHQLKEKEKVINELKGRLNNDEERRNQV